MHGDCFQRPERDTTLQPGGAEASTPRRSGDEYQTWETAMRNRNKDLWADTVKTEAAHIPQTLPWSRGARRAAWIAKRAAAADETANPQRRLASA